jgi:hypothetical protein
LLAIVGVLGALLVVLGGVFLVTPSRFQSFIAFWLSDPRIYLALFLRLFMGVVLLAASAESRLPLVLRVLGIVSLLAALVGVLMGPARLRAMASWWTGRSVALIRLWAVVTAALGAVLLYAVSPG